MADFVPGQRWINDAESQLGLGTVLSSDHRSVTLLFLATGDTRTYAKQSAQLTRVKFSVGDTIKTEDGVKLTVDDCLESDGLLTYIGSNEAGESIELQESQLDNFIQLTGPIQRLFNGQIDPDKWFELRYQTRQLQNQLWESELRVLNGCRTSLIPHQLYIAHEVGNRYAPRVLLADEVGLGKTIEAGLIIHFQLITERAQRVLIAVPQSLVNQWFVEMLRRFNLHFSIFDESRCSATEESSGHKNPFHSEQLVLCSLDFLTANPNRTEQALDATWNLAVVDEAHHLEWSPKGCNAGYRIVEQLAAITNGLLLITATPEQLGKEGHFARLRLLDPVRFNDFDAFIGEEKAYKPVADAICALLSGHPLKAEGQKLLADSIREGDNQSLLETLARTDHNMIDFQAARQELIDHLLDRHGTGRVLFRNTRAAIKGFPQRNVTGYKIPCPTEYATIARNEICDPEMLISPEIIYQSLAAQDSTKWTDIDPRVVWLKDKLHQLRPNKVLLIAVHADTAIGVAETLKAQWGINAAVFHERMSILERDRAAAYFANLESGCQILICSEIGSEGRNFQFAHHLILFDLPLNPDLLQQRIGRLDRIGQTDSVQVHVPYLEPGAQSILFHWYHQGLNAFEKHCATGHAVFTEVENKLRAAISGDFETLDELVNTTRQFHQRMNQALQNGRDRLLEYNSCRPGLADELKKKAELLDKDVTLPRYMETILDNYGVESEAYDESCLIVRPGNPMLAPFPHLPDDGITVTFDRQTALAKEDFEYLSWEHPLVTGAMELIVSQETGNSALSAVELSNIRPGVLLLECIYVVEIAKIDKLQTERYLAPTTLRWVIDENRRDRSDISQDQFKTSRIRIDAETANKILQSKQQEIKTLIAHTDSLATTHAEEILKKSHQQADQTLQNEINRLQALQRINPNVRADEIEFLQNQLDALNRVIDSGYVRMDAIRILISL